MVETDELVQSYRRDGFVRVQNVLAPEEAERYRAAALDAAERLPATLEYETRTFKQLVNAWQADEVMRELTLHPRLAELARALAGTSLRLWHDQILIKEPRVAGATQFHFDSPYWPHRSASHWITAWVALVDVTVEKGCMTFIPESFRRPDVLAVDLENETALFDAVPDLAWEPRVTLPLRAGDCTFHHGSCAHAANANRTDDPRVAHAIIYMDSTTTYSGAEHVLTDPLGLTPGETFADPLFPEV